MSKFANTSAVPLSLAVFLATDNYDHNEDPNTISATALIKPLRQIILAARVPEDVSPVDLVQLVPSRMGTAIHDAIERAWKNNAPSALEALGYPKRVIEKIRINPKPEELHDGLIPIYMEQRAHKQVGKYVISGKYDFIGDGRVEDFKSTSTYTAMNNTNDEKHTWQGSIYRWLNPKIITRDEMAIQYIFTDWSKAKAMADPKYPQQRIQQRILPLKSIQETDAFVNRKLAQIEQYWDAPEDQIPLCTDADLWRSEPVFKYYKNPDKRTRSTKNFDNFHDAQLRCIEDGNVGVVVEQPGQVTACKYCAAFAVCSQKDKLIASGDLVL
jgi:hypothetical protein